MAAAVAGTVLLSLQNDKEDLISLCPLLEPIMCAGRQGL